MTEKEKLADLAQLAATLPVERRRELNQELPFDGSPRVNAGIVLGLAHAAEVLAASSPDSAKELREMAAVGAARVLSEDRQLQQVLKEWESPEARAALEAEAELIRAGKLQGVSIDDVIQQMEEQAKKHRAGK